MEKFWSYAEEKDPLSYKTWVGVVKNRTWTTGYSEHNARKTIKDRDDQYWSRLDIAEPESSARVVERGKKVTKKAKVKSRHKQIDDFFKLEWDTENQLQYTDGTNQTKSIQRKGSKSWN